MTNPRDSKSSFLVYTIPLNALIDKNNNEPNTELLFVFLICLPVLELLNLHAFPKSIKYI